MIEDFPLYYTVLGALIAIGGTIAGDRVRAWRERIRAKRDTINAIISELEDNKCELEKQNYTLEIENELPKANVHFFGTTAFESAVTSGNFYRLSSDSQIQLSHLYDLAKVANLRARVLMQNVINFDVKKEKATQNYLNQLQIIHERILNDIDDVINELKIQF